MVAVALVRVVTLAVVEQSAVVQAVRVIVPEAEVTVLLLASRTATTGCVPKAVPAVALVEGFTVNATWVATGPDRTIGDPKHAVSVPFETFR